VIVPLLLGEREHEVVILVLAIGTSGVRHSRVPEHEREGRVRTRCRRSAATFCAAARRNGRRVEDRAH